MKMSRDKFFRETFKVDDSYLVDTEHKLISAPHSIKEGDYPQDIKDLISKGYKIQLNIL